MANSLPRFYMNHLTQYDGAATSDIPPRKDMTATGNVGASGLMLHTTGRAMEEVTWLSYV